MLWADDGRADGLGAPATPVPQATCSAREARAKPPAGEPSMLALRNRRSAAFASLRRFAPGLRSLEAAPARVSRGPARLRPSVGPLVARRHRRRPARPRTNILPRMKSGRLVRIFDP